MSKTEIKENKMGVMPIGKLLISMSVPIMISMLVQALYNIVDSIFVAMLSENALTAVSLAFPMQNLMIAVASGTAVGVNALLSKSLGEKNFDEVNNAANNGVFLAIISWMAFAVLGLCFSRYYFETQTSNAEILEYGCDYLYICTIASLGIFGQVTFERLLTSTGKTFYAMITQLSGAVTNIILDPILIFGLLGFPKMGVAGAALATVIGQFVGMFLAIFFNVSVNNEIKLKPKGFRPNPRTIRQIYYVGVPSMAMMAIGSVMTYGMNRILLAFTSTAAAVFGVYFKLQSFIFMPVFGMNNGIIPILSYNYGAHKKDRIVKTIRLGVIYALAIMLIGCLIFQLFAPELLSLFNASEEMLNIGVKALRTISYSFLFAGFCIVLNGAFQAFGKAMFSLLISVTRQLIVLLPAAYLLSRTGRLELVWLAFPIAELASVSLTLIFMVYLFRTVINCIPDTESTSKIEASSEGISKE